MTRYVIDAAAAIELARTGAVIPAEHQLVAPSLLRSQVLDAVYRSFRRGELSSSEGRSLLDGFARMRIRLLGDRVSRATAWRIAERLGWDDTADAEYLAVTQLQADALIALDPALAERARGVTPLATLAELLGEAASR
jgi:predicted nucleic acid-binding protein